MYKTSFYCLRVLILAAALSAVLPAQAQLKQPLELLVQINDSLTEEQDRKFKDIVLQHDLKVTKKYLHGKLNKLKIFKKSKWTEEDIAEALMASGAVKFAEPNYLVQPSRLPNDPAYTNQWYHGTLGMPLAWDITTGNSQVKIGVCDTGFNTAHPDLAGKFILPGWNAVTGTSDLREDYEHGTQTAGVLAATGNNSSGGTGILWDARIIPIKVAIDATGISSYEALAACVEYAANGGAKVVNMSYTGASSAAVASAAEYLRSKGGLLFVAAGNEGHNFDGYTPDFPSFLTVGSVDNRDQQSWFSNYGLALDIVAPGEQIYTTTRDGAYGITQGTSFSSPIAAGVAALLYALKPAFSPQEVERFIVGSAIDLGAAGRDPVFGQGRINASAAIQAAIRSDLTKPSVAITSPANGARVLGTISIKVNAADDMRVKYVQLNVDGIKLATDSTAPYAFSLDTLKLMEGVHLIQAEAVDLNGNKTVATIKINVDNSAAAPPVITVDNIAAGAADAFRSFSGKWCLASAAGTQNGTYLKSCGTGLDAYRWTPGIQKAGYYSVYTRWAAGASRSSSVPYTVTHALGKTTKSFNQRLTGGTWILHGRYYFKSGSTGYIELSDVNGEAAADAVQLVPSP